MNLGEAGEHLAAILHRLEEQKRRPGFAEPDNRGVEGRGILVASFVLFLSFWN